MKSLLFVLFAFLLTSCNPFEPKPLEVITIKKNGITARRFITSTNTIHSHVEIKTREGWVQVLEGNDYAYSKIRDVRINKDTVIIQADKGIHLYELVSVCRGIHIRVDTAVGLAP